MKLHDDHDVVPIVITLKVLAELNQIAVRHQLKLKGLSYTEAQQALTIYSLIKYFESYGLKLPLKLELPK